MSSSNKDEGLVYLKKNTHMQYPCATIQIEFAIQQNETCLMESGGNMKRSMATFCSIRTSCEAKVSVPQSGDAVSAGLKKNSLKVLKVF